MITAALVIAAGLLVCRGLFLVMEDADRPENKVYLLSDDDQALWAHYLAAENYRQATARACREATRRRYEFITWPAVQQEIERRRIEAQQEAGRVARRLESLGGVA